MNKIIKLVGLLFLPLAILIFVVSFFNTRTPRSGKGFFIQEFDEQNIYG